MKPLLYFFTLLFCASGLTAQTVPSSCTAPPNIVQQYSDDADYMTLKRIIAMNHSYKDRIEIPQAWADTAMRALLAVYNATSLPARDSVVTRYKIHEYATPTQLMIFLTADSNETYMKQMKQNIFPTGDADFDNLGNLYTIKSSQYLAFPPTGIYKNLTLQLDSAYNTPILKDEYNILSGLQTAQGTLNLFGDSDHITYDVTPNYVELRYIHGWTNCQDNDGCDKQHTWTFRVSYNCDVTYVGSSGDPLFPPVNSIKEIEATGINIYPNPTKDILHTGFTGNYKIYNMQGTIVATNNTTGTIDIASLPAGQYLLQLQNESGSYYHRFTRQ